MAVLAAMRRRLAHARSDSSSGMLQYYFMVQYELELSQTCAIARRP